MTYSFRHSLTLALAAGCLAALTISISAGGAPTPEELDALFVRYDREADGLTKERLAERIDAMAHQKYATVSRLYWHTDLSSAKAAAREQERPILHLRMLGRLDEELSCANSRLFRATLYANQNLSRFLRENFVLYWSSERPVPRVTIDYGDGRRLERTTTGNSAHYVLDVQGNVLDVLPGLYAPVAFRRELDGSLALAARVRGTSDNQRAKLIVEHHEQRLALAERNWKRLPGTSPLLAQVRGETSLAAAQRVTMSKSGIELRDLRVIARGLAPASIPEDDIAKWSEAGQVLYGIGDLKNVLDETSRALVVRLHNALPRELRSARDNADAVVARLERTILADTALNQLRLRPQIGREIVRRAGRTDFETLNAWIYSEVFHTPKQDAWLGLLPRDGFTGLPGDGVVLR